MDCIFCKISQKKITSKIVYEDDDYLAFLDQDQTHKGHTLIIPKKHIEDINGLSKEELYELFTIAKKISINLNAKGITYLFNYGDSQEVKHVHLHVIPNYFTRKKDSE